MQTRHRIPNIFNLSMVDVLCCALGCIILLWLVYFKEARERTIAAGQTNKQLEATKLKLDSVLLDLTSAQKDVFVGKQKNEHLGGQLQEVINQRDQLLAKWEKTDNAYQAALKKLKDAAAAIAALGKDVKDLETLNATAQAILGQKAKDYDNLTAQFLAATQNVGRLEKTLKEQKGVVALTEAQAAALKIKLTDAEKNAGDLTRQLDSAKTLAQEYAGQLAKIEAKAMSLDTELDKRKLDLLESSKRHDDLLAIKILLEQSLAANKTDLAKSDKALAAARAELAKYAVDLAANKVDMTKQALNQATLKVELAKSEDALAAAKSELAKYAADLAAAKAELGKYATELAGARAELGKNSAQLAVTKNDLTRSQAALDQSKLLNMGLVGETKVLSEEVNKLRASVDNRFAGIELTGSRVIFMVDMSGSMRMKDEKTEDPDKWPLVCEILGKLMKSLPDLKQFQVILFSDKVRYPLGNAGKWFDYHGPSSAKNVIDAVRAEVPENETNMSAVFEEAFKYRAMGLDTVYMLSDGLPNAGDGLPKGAEKLPYTDQSILLGKYIRDRLKTTWNVPYGRWAKQRVRINAVGFFFDSPDVGAFLWALARDNDGSFVGLSKP